MDQRLTNIRKNGLGSMLFVESDDTMYMTLEFLDSRDIVNIIDTVQNTKANQYNVVTAEGGFTLVTCTPDPLGQVSLIALVKAIKKWTNKNKNA